MTARKKTRKRPTKLKSKTLQSNRALVKVFSMRSGPVTKMSVDS